MSVPATSNYLNGLIRELRQLPKETEWVEFKANRGEPQEIGEYISALANSARLLGKSSGWLVWGIDNATHEIVGTSFDPAALKVGNEEAENWLLQRLKPKLHFQFHQVEIEGLPMVLLEIPAAYRHPVSFTHQEFIRVGSYKKKLNEFPDKERALWRILDETPFETLFVLEQVDSDTVLKLLDYPKYFELLDQPLPNGHTPILEALVADGLLCHCEAGGFNITNLGAILLARKLDDFAHLGRKAVRVILYRGSGRIETVREQVGGKGYATGFEGLIEFLMALLPTNEVIGEALRDDVPMYPQLAVRELVANALIHQDFVETGTGPLVEIFDDRMEITNPGTPLIATDRFLDSPPKSRNEKLASLMRRFGVCEERGSGIDKVVYQTELYQLPAPLFETPNGFTRAVLYAHIEFDAMSKQDRVRACYLHCCLQYIQNKRMTNRSLRERFGLLEDAAGRVSRVISATAERGLIVNASASESRRDTSYVPFWSTAEGGLS